MKRETIFVEENNKEYIILIGQNAKDNENIIKMSEQNDLWFHVDNLPSAHIILQSNGDIIPKRYLNKICSLFRDNSSKLTSRYNIIYTTIKNVKLTRECGKVITSNTKMIKM